MRIAVMDLDGTLVDSFEDIAGATNHALVSLGASPLSTAEIKSHVGHGLRNLLQSLLPDPGEETLDRAMEMVQSYYSEHPTDHSVLYPGVSAALDRLGRAGVCRVVLSNKTDPLVQLIAKDLGLDGHTEEIRGHRDGFPLKPDPTSLMDILNRYGCTPDQCVVVGDYSPDQELARNAGARFCAVTWGMTPREGWELRNGDWIIDRPEELAELLGG